MRIWILLPLFSLFFSSPLFNACKNQEKFPSAPSEFVPEKYGTADYSEEWKEVERLEKEGKPRSALEVVKKIRDAAASGYNPGQHVKAVIFMLKFESQFVEEPQISAIRHLEEEVKTGYFPVRSIFQSLLAEAYEGHFNNNRYNMGAASSGNGGDIYSWSVEQYMDTITSLHLHALEPAKELAEFEIGRLSEILEGEETFRELRPSVFDILAYRAIDFFTTKDDQLTRGVTEFFVDKEEYFAPGGEFASMQITTPLESDGDYLALKTFQTLYQVHENLYPKIYADLQRLEFVYGKTIVENKEEKYYRALKDIAEKGYKEKIAGDAWFKMAELANSGFLPGEYKNLKYPKEAAIAICEKGMEEYPKTFPASKCNALKEEILRKEYSTRFRQTYIPAEYGLFHVTYRNMEQLFLRVYPVEEKTYEKISDLPREKFIAEVSKMEFIHEKEYKLPLRDDHNFHTTLLDIPPLENGRYILITSYDKDFDYDENKLTYSSSQVTRLSLIKPESPGTIADFIVVDAKTGAFLEGVTVKIYRHIHRGSGNNRDYLKTILSGKNGAISLGDLQNKGHANYFLELSKGDDHFFPQRLLSLYQISENNIAFGQVEVFTDRSVYRPGQVLHFKGIATRKRKNSPVVLIPNHNVVIKLMDPNYQLISEKKLTTNDFGSVSGTFFIPEGGLTGTYLLQASADGLSQINTPVRVEEYKRPSFEVIIDSPSTAYKLNEEVEISGNAMNFSNVPLAGARVQYKVTRNYIFPWYYFSRPGFPYPGVGEDKLITVGTLSADDKGEFRFNFKAIPDPEARMKYDPVFNYTVTVTVTDISGETQEQNIFIQASSNPWVVSVQFPDEAVEGEKWINGSKKLNFIPVLENLAGKKQNQPVRVRIAKLKPERLLTKDYFPPVDTQMMGREDFIKKFPHHPYGDEYNPLLREEERTVFQKDHPANKKLEIDPGTLSAGVYKLIVTKGEKGKYEMILNVYDPEKTESPFNEFLFVIPEKTVAKPGEKAVIWLGSGDKNASSRIVFHLNGRTIFEKVVRLSGKKEKIEFPVKEEHRGNIGVSIFSVNENTLITKDLTIFVPWDNKKLKLSLTTFSDKLKPGGEEEWTLEVKGPGGEKVVAEILASMYDVSLDLIQPHSWDFSPHRTNYTGGYRFEGFSSFGNAYGSPFEYDWNRRLNIQEPSFERIINYGIFYTRYRKGLYRGEIAMADAFKEESEEVLPQANGVKVEEKASLGKSKNGNSPDVKIRQNFSETAFFYPHLVTGEDGSVRITFTTPESLTRWKLMLLGHTRDLVTGTLNKEVVAEKKLQIIPNFPRFTRVGDNLVLSVKVANLSDKSIEGRVTIDIQDANSSQRLKKYIGKDLALSPGESSAFQWEVEIPEGHEGLEVTVRAYSDEHSDGMRTILPVLPSRIFVTSTKPLWLTGPGKRSFTLEDLKNSDNPGEKPGSRVVVEMVSNPSWYAVQALPYLAEYPYDCAEQVFNRFYANRLSSFIVSENPKIEETFSRWGEPESPLNKNEDLKNILLTESPWVREAASEKERMQSIALLFNRNHINSSIHSAVNKLREMQLPNGAWPWFPGMRENVVVTQYILAGAGHLEKVKAMKGNSSELRDLLPKAISWTDKEMMERYQWLLDHKVNMENDHYGFIDAQYLYSRSFFTNLEIKDRHRKGYDFWMKQAAENWVKKDLVTQAMTAMALFRNGDNATAKKIIASLKERSLKDEEMGMYWRDNSTGWGWSEDPISTQALLIEAFLEISEDEESVNLMKIWLLKQKQVQSWETTKATADACYALLIRGGDWLKQTGKVSIRLGGKELEEKEGEPGTGYVQYEFSGKAVDRNMGDITIEGQNEGPSWGAVYYQRFEELGDITSNQTSLGIQKTLFKEVQTGGGAKFEKTTNFEVGDLVVVKLTITTDRDIEYIHLKDMRAAALEPVEALSGYRYKGGLGFYQSIRDASMNFFFDHLSKGTHVLEYRLRVSHPGTYENGISTIQSMYAPSFASHTESVEITVEK